MKVKVVSLFLLLCFQSVKSQSWVDTLYGYQMLTNVTYGVVTDFAGNTDQLKMDICIPVGDTPPVCGRPLLVAVHGGGFMSGYKEDYVPHQMMIDFAKRGYVTASVSYRLGMFNTSTNWHCNVTYFGVPYDCLNMADSTEWYRGYYRGIQDVKGAIRYLVSKKNDYTIDAGNVFIAGESAGGFISMGVAFMDSSAEKPAQCNAQSAVSPPNSIYEAPCIQTFGWDSSIASMQLARPDLGPVEGTLWVADSNNYSLKGVGAFYGAMFQDLFSINTYDDIPVLYMFHQPNDLIVDQDYSYLFIGYSYCLVTNFGCAYPINIPRVHGSKSIRDLIEYHDGLGDAVPVYVLDTTLNNADCAQQAGNPNLVGHQPDNYWNRSYHIAQTFATRINELPPCYPVVSITEKELDNEINIFPNPAGSEIHVESTGPHLSSILLYDISGRDITSLVQISSSGNSFTINQNLEAGVFYMRIFSGERSATRKVVVVR